MAYQVYLNNQVVNQTLQKGDLLFDSTRQSDGIAFIQPHVRLDVNAAGSFDFTITPKHWAYNRLTKLKDWVHVYRDRHEDRASRPVFEGRIYQIQTQLNGLKNISCEGLLSVLNDSISRPYSGTLYPATLFHNLIDSHNEQVEERKRITIYDASPTAIPITVNYEDYVPTITRVKNMLSQFGGYLFVGMTDIYGQTESSGLRLHWINDPVPVSSWTECTQEIVLKKNLLDIQKTDICDTNATILIPLGAKGQDDQRLTVASVNSGKDYIVTTAQYPLNLYGRIVKTVIWDDIADATTLYNQGVAYLNKILTGRTIIKVKAADLADAGYKTGHYFLGDKIKVTSIPHGINGKMFRCTKQDLYLLDPKLNTLELEAIET